VPDNGFTGTNTFGFQATDQSATSTTATVTINVTSCTAPAITSTGQPANQSITYGANTSFTAAASGTAPVGVQWQVKTTAPGAVFTNIPTATSSPLSLTKPPVSDSGNQYRAVFTNACGSATSNPATLTVNPKSITITPNSGQSKVYGSADPTLTYSASPGLESGDNFTGALARASGNNVGNYAINLGTLSAGGNYNLSLSSPTVNFEITKKALTITGLSANNKVYDGNTNATFTGTPSLVGVVGSDDVSLTGTASGTFASKEVGNNIAVTVSGLSLIGGAKDNYTLTLPTGLKANITAWNAEGRGFYQPVGIDNSEFVAAPGTPPTTNNTDVWNTAKGGSTVPLKFNVFAGTVEKTSLSDIQGFTANKLANCTASGATEDPIDFTTTGSTTLRYDTSQWIQNWQTPKVSNDTCYRTTVKFADGSTISAFFKLKK